MFQFNFHNIKIKVKMLILLRRKGACKTLIMIGLKFYICLPGLKCAFFKFLVGIGARIVISVTETNKGSEYGKKIQ